MPNKHEELTKVAIQAFHYEVGLLLNFGPTPTKKRKIFDNNKKPNLQLK